MKPFNANTTDSHDWSHRQIAIVTSEPRAPKGAGTMSGLGQKRTLRPALAISALPPKRTNSEAVGLSDKILCHFEWSRRRLQIAGA